jgi:hypothetical protein
VGLIDWAGLIRNALWILGLSIVLAAWSYASWKSSLLHVSVTKMVAAPGFTMPCFAGLALFSAGLAWGADRLWLRVLWIVIGLGCLWEVWQAWRAAASSKQTSRGEPDETH